MTTTTTTMAMSKGVPNAEWLSVIDAVEGTGRIGRTERTGRTVGRRSGSGTSWSGKTSWSC